MTEQLDFLGVLDAPEPPTGRELAEEGMQRAIDKAQRDTDGAFEAAALEFLVEFAAQAGRPVTLPEVRMAARGHVPEVEEQRSWGPIPIRARNLGYLAAAGYLPSPDPKSHARPCAAWLWTGKVFA